MVKRLDDAAVASGLSELEGWSLEDGKLHREFKFADFRDAWAFMSGAALAAEAANHHPEWFNVYATVRVHLTTHDCGGISKKDFALAREMSALAARLL